MGSCITSLVSWRMRVSGNRISLRGRAFCTTSCLTNWTRVWTTGICRMWGSFGHDTKVDMGDNVGDFRDDMKNGKGTLYFSNG